MRKWIETRLEEINRSKSDLARHLKLPFARVAEMINGKRAINALEVLPISSFLNLNPVDVLVLLGKDDDADEYLAVVTGANTQKPSYPHKTSDGKVVEFPIKHKVNDEPQEQISKEVVEAVAFVLASNSQSISDSPELFQRVFIGLCEHLQETSGESINEKDEVINFAIKQIRGVSS